MNIDDAYSHPLFNPEIDRRTGYRTRSMLTCAITDSSGKPTAVLQALNKRGDGARFTQEDEQQLRLVRLGPVRWGRQGQPAGGGWCSGTTANVLGAVRIATWLRRWVVVPRAVRGPRAWSLECRV